MNARSIGFLSLAVLAGLALWLLLAGPERIFGIDTGNAGIFLLMAIAWGALGVLHWLPSAEVEGAIAPGEWRAWIGALFIAQMMGYLLLKSSVFAGAQLPHNPDATAVGRTLVMLLVAWAIVSSVLSSRWQGRVQEDERDLEIARSAASWGAGALVALIIGIAVMLAFTPLPRLAWATPLVLANLLVFALMWSSLVEHVVSAVQYWRDRH